MVTQFTTRKSTKAFHPAQEEDDDLETAFRALATFMCSKCNTPLDGTPRPNQRGYQEPDQAPERSDRHICCKTAHCSYCGKPASARCRHLVALREYGTWRLPGFVRGRVVKQVRGSAPAHDLPDGQMVDYEEDQKQEAFRTAYPLLALIYGEGFTRKSDAPVPLAPILGPHFLRGDRQMVVNGLGRFHHYHFSQNPEATREKARQMIHDLEEGVVRMKQMTPSALRFLHRDLDIATASATPKKFGRDGISALLFSPDGRLLLVGIPGEAQLWDVKTGELHQQLSLRSISSSDSAKDDITAAFSPDGSHLSLAMSSEWSGYGYTDDGHKNVSHTSVFHVATGQKVADIPSVNLTTYRTGHPTDALLCNGSVVARARGRFMHLTPVGEAGKSVLGGCRPVRLPHRTLLRSCAFSPDGRTLATVQSAYPANDLTAHRVLLWRIQPDS